MQTVEPQPDRRVTRLPAPHGRPGAARAARLTASVMACALIPLIAAGCAGAGLPEPVATTSTTTTTARSSAPVRPAVRLQGEPARAAAAVGTLSRALREGDVEGLCRPGVIFTAAVIADIESDGASCEASDEVSAMVGRPPALAVVGLAFRPDLATAQVSVDGQVVPLDIVRDGRRWLISFSDGVDPLDALEP